MNSIEVQIRGVSALLVHAFGLDFENADQARTIVRIQKTPREQAESVVYRDTEHFYVPSTWIIGALRDAGANHKLRGSRRSLRFVVPSAVFVMEENITICLQGQPVKDFEVDSRPVTIPSTKGRIMRHRPRFDMWELNFHLEVDPNTLPTDLVHQLLEEVGRSIGIGDFRPAKGGPFGRFAITKWEI
jgi:hypothetical protein